MLDMTACRGRELYAFTKKGAVRYAADTVVTVEFCLMPSAPIDNVRADFPMGYCAGCLRSYIRGTSKASSLF